MNFINCPISLLDTESLGGMGNSLNAVVNLNLTRRLATDLLTQSSSERVLLVFCHHRWRAQVIHVRACDKSQYHQGHHHIMNRSQKALNNSPLIILSAPRQTVPMPTLCCNWGPNVLPCLPEGIKTNNSRSFPLPLNQKVELK